ncbi:MAG: formate dehydrogenase [Bacteroidetes bacterium HGW-Bacteroidetes-21]|nr:MAG: formate dehydrogenase [Bacteroidetes bacterium HGW-Bacteroidetes-21]
MANNNTRSLSGRKELRQNLFEEIATLASQKATNDSFKHLADEFLMNDSTVFATTSFYDFTRDENRQHKIHICNGSACLTAGTQNKIKTELEKHFTENEIGHVACLGHCHKNSAIMYDSKTYSVDESMPVEKIVKDKPVVKNLYYVGSDTHAILTAPVSDIAEFFSLAESLKTAPEKVIQEIKTSGLRGRGGAGFPFYFKAEAVLKEKNKQKYIVCNADEGDPGAYSDMYLLENQPYKVLFGMYISGLITGADTGVVYIRGEYPESIRVAQKSILMLKDLNLTPGFRWKIIGGQGAYICGEETALLNSIEGLRPEVRVRPPFPAQYGLFGKPTVLSNVESFANLHWILQNGGEAFASIGTQKSTGTKLVSLDSHFNRPGIYEVEMGTPIQEIIDVHGKGFNKAIKAVQVGGPLGGIVPVEKLKNLTLDFESFSKAGFLLGHASFVCIPNDFPMIRYLEHLMKFTADESCGKCFPCRIGSFRGYEMLVKAQQEEYKIDKALFNDLLETLQLGSLCALGGGIPLPVRNALQYFDEELKNYFN